MMRKFRTFFQMPRREKALFLEAYVTLGVIRLAVLATSLKYLVRFLDHDLDKDETSSLNAGETQTVLSVKRIIRKAAGRTPWKSECLVQSLAAQRILHKRNIPGSIYLGVKKGTEGFEKMQAHAWTKSGDVFVTGGRGYEAYTVVSVFSWRKK
jgi:hypothetical protein